MAAGGELRCLAKWVVESGGAGGVPEDFPMSFLLNDALENGVKPFLEINDSETPYKQILIQKSITKFSLAPLYIQYVYKDRKDLSFFVFLKKRFEL